jgi:hypothetical protein
MPDHRLHRKNVQFHRNPPRITENRSQRELEWGTRWEGLAVVLGERSLGLEKVLVVVVVSIIGEVWVLGAS